MVAAKWSVLVLGAALLACPAPPEETPDAGGGAPDGSTGFTPFEVSVLDAEASGLQPIALAQAGTRLGVAYFSAGAQSGDWDLHYLEWQDGEVTRRSKVQTVQRVAGVSVAFGANGQPAVAYLGGESDESLLWNQSDAVISWGQSDGTWVEEIVVRESNEAPAGNPTSDTGVVVGVFPALAFRGDETLFAYRDVHGGQFPQQDWAPSDVEIAIGSTGAWDKKLALNGNTDQGFGGHLRMVLADGEPAISCDQILGDAVGAGQNVVFTRRESSGAWLPPVRVMDVGNAQSGPSLAHDPQLGFAIAVVDRSDNQLSFLSSTNGGTTWTVPDPVYQSGTGGWWPSLSIEAETHEPSIAFYVCGRTTGLNEGGCPEGEDELRVTRRIEGRWRETLVDAEGGYLPQLTHFADGRRGLVYRHPRSGALKLAVER